MAKRTTSHSTREWKPCPKSAQTSGRRPIEPTPADVARALAGEESAFTRLVDLLMPVIHTRLARALLRYDMDERQLHQEVEELTQEVFVGLLAQGGKVLRGWDPLRGMSLRNYVGLIAERQAAAQLRRRQHTAGLETPELERQSSPDADPEEDAISRQRLQQLILRLREELSPLGWHLFELFFVEELPVEEIRRRTNLSADAVYAWRSRLRRLARRLTRGE